MKSMKAQLIAERFNRRFLWRFEFISEVKGVREVLPTLQ